MAWKRICLHWSTDSKRGICSYHGVWIAWSARWLGLCSVSVIPGAKGSKHFVLAVAPLSNTETVLAKWLYGWILLPMTYFLIGWVAGGIIVLISSIGAAAMVSDTALIAEAMAIHGVGLASHAGTMMVQVAWIAPFFAWSLLVSQWALRTPLLWVLGVPLVATLVENLLLMWPG